jgi:hypothetical protein
VSAPPDGVFVLAFQVIVAPPATLFSCATRAAAMAALTIEPVFAAASAARSKPTRGANAVIFE